MRKVRVLSKIALCALLVVALLSQITLPIFAESHPLYIREIQISTGKTEQEAKQWLIDNGYTILDEDLNVGTGKDYAYIGYKTTTDRNLAICDISMMSMNGGYKTMNYGALLDQVKESATEVIENILVALAEFRANYEVGSPNAIIAKETLDLLLYDEGSDETLGDYLLSPDRTVDDITNLLFMCNSLVASLIYNQLALGVSDYADYTDSTWLDRLCIAGPLPEEMTPNELDRLDDLYYKKAEKLMYVITEFMNDVYDAYDRMDDDNNGSVESDEVDVGLTTEEEAEIYLSKILDGEPVDTTNNDLLVLAVYDYLQWFEYGDYTVADLFDDVAWTEDVRLLYPLIESGLTEGQFAAMQLCGVVNMTIASVNEAENYEKAHEELLAKGEELIAANNGVKPTAFIGVNKDVYLTDVGLTTEAERAAASSGNYAQLTEDDPLRADLKMALMACGMVALASIGVSIIAMSVTVGGVIAGFGVFAMVAAVATSAMASIGSFAAAVGLLAPAALGVIAVVAVIAILVVMLIDWIKDSYNDKHPQYTEIPKTMFDYDMVTSKYIRYSAVRERNGDPGDINCFQGREWAAMYVSYDPDSGSPITANDMGEFFRVKRGNSEVANTYVGLCNFGESSVANLNTHAYKDKVNGLYLFYTTEDSLAGITAEEQSGRYLSSVMLVQAESAEEARLAIKKMSGYEVLEFNLTPDYHKRYTYIGYRTTTNPANAITDLRIHVAMPTSGDNSDDMTGQNITFGNGGAAYACAGVYGYEYANGTKEAIMLYYTKQASCGDPIMADFYTTRDFSDVPEGYEPVNYFSGGPAFNFASRNGVEIGSTSEGDHSYVYFRYENPYSDDEEDQIYLGGLATLEMLKYEVKLRTLDQMAEDLGWEIIDVDLKNVDSSYQNYGGLRLCYTKTSNPKRAIYDIRTYLYEPKAQNVVSNINFCGAGYMILDGYEMKSGQYYPKTNHSLLIDSDLTDNHNRFSVGSKRGSFETTIYSGYKEGYVSVTTAPRAMGIYVCGPMIDTTAKKESERKIIDPILVSEFYVGSQANAPEGLSAVVDFTDHYGERPVDVSANRGVYIYYKAEYPEKLKYIQSIEIVYCDTPNFAYDQAKLTLLASQGDEILDFNLASVSGSTMFESDDCSCYYKTFNSKYADKAAFIKVTRTKTKAYAMRDIRIVEVGKNDAAPSKTMKINGYEYTRVSNKICSTRINGLGYILSADKSTLPTLDLSDYYFYVYTGGYNVAITDITFDALPIRSGTFTVVDNNGKTNVKNPWWMHMESPDIADMTYMSRAGVVSAGTYSDGDARKFYCGESVSAKTLLYCNILNSGFTSTMYYDFNDGTEKGNMVYLAYSKTKDASTAITNLITSEKYASTISVNGIQYTLGTGTSFNDSLKFGNTIYLYYTTNSSAGKPIVQLHGLNTTTSSREFLQRAEGGVSNLNLNAADKESDCNNDYTLIPHYLMIIRDGETPIKTVNLTASVFSGDPKLTLIVVIAGISVVLASGAVVIKKIKGKKVFDTEED